MINTVCLSAIGLVLGTVISFLFAVFLNKLIFTRFKKITQTISYLPHFVLWVIIASIGKSFFNDGGVIDTMFGANRFQRMWHITLPAIKPTVIVLLIMNVGNVLNFGMERQMLLSVLKSWQ